MKQVCSILYTATVPSRIQQIQFSGNCLEPILKKNFPTLCSNAAVVFSANGSSEMIALTNDTTNFFEVEALENNIIVCFKNTDPFFQKFGDVKEVLVQEYCALFYSKLCTNLSVIGMGHELGIFGSRGILTLDPNGTGMMNSRLLLLNKDLCIIGSVANNFVQAHCYVNTIQLH